MKEASPFEVEGLVRGYPRGAAWHCTFYTPAGRTRLKLATKNKRQAERRAREIAELIQREDWEALSKLNWKPMLPLSVLLVRVYKLHQPVSVPYLPEYGGCTSWVEVLSDVNLGKIKPVLDDTEFQRRIDDIKGSLGLAVTAN